MQRFHLESRNIRDHLPAPTKPPLLKLYNDGLYGSDFVEISVDNDTPAIEVISIERIISHALVITSINGNYFACRLNRGLMYC